MKLTFVTHVCSNGEYIRKDTLTYDVGLLVVHPFAISDAGTVPSKPIARAIVPENGIIERWYADDRTWDYFTIE